MRPTLAPICPRALIYDPATRRVTGTPTELGTVTATYTATVGADSFERTFQLHIVSAALVANAQRDILMVQGVVYAGVALSQATPGSGTGPYTYPLDSSQLPLGVNFDPTTVTLDGYADRVGQLPRRAVGHHGLGGAARSR